MLTIHHLGVSQSDRIVWLVEELGLPYRLKWYSRGADGLQPPEYVALHPASTAPVVDDDGKRLCESAAILEYVCQKYAGGKLTVRPDQPNYYDYLYWMHFNNNVQGLFFAKLALGDRKGPEAERISGFIKRREDGYYRHLDERLAAAPYLAGPEFTCADIMVTFNLTELPLFGGRKIDDLPNAQAYVARIGARPAYQKAMAIAGPGAKPPTGAQ
jgi:glutathione S-transferase